MAYNAYDVTKPDPTTQAITAYSQSIRNNDAALRDAVVSGAFKGWNYSQATATFNATWSGTTLTLTSAITGQLAPGMTVSVSGVAKGKVVSQSGGATFGASGATFVMDTSQAYGSPTAMTAGNADGSLPYCDLYSYSTTEKLVGVYTYNVDLNCTSEKWYYWTSTGGVYDLIGTETYGYDGSQNLTSSTWS